MILFKKVVVVLAITLAWGAVAAEGAADTGFAVPEVLSFKAEGRPPQVQAELINPFSKDSMKGAFFEITCSDGFGRDVQKSLLVVDRAARNVILDQLPSQDVDFIREIDGSWGPKQKVTIDLKVKSETTPEVTTCRALELWSVW